MNKKMVDILVMTLKTPASIYICLASQGVSLELQNIHVHKITTDLTCSPSTQKETIQEGQHPAPLFTGIVLRGAHTPEICCLTSLPFIPSKSQFKYKETVSTQGTLGSHSGLESPCIPSNNISCKTFLAQLPMSRKGHAL